MPKMAEMEVLLVFFFFNADPEVLLRLVDFEYRYLEEIYKKIGLFSSLNLHENEKGLKFPIPLIQELGWSPCVFSAF